MIEIDGDVICINDIGFKSQLTFNKKYKVLDILRTNLIIQAIKVSNNFDNISWYDPDLFITINEYRKKKLLEINMKNLGIDDVAYDFYYMDRIDSDTIIHNKDKFIKNKDNFKEFYDNANIFIRKEKLNNIKNEKAKNRKN